MKPLPPGWKPCQEENGELYYFNFDTGKSSWDHPCDEISKARVVDERYALFSLMIVVIKIFSLSDEDNQHRQIYLIQIQEVKMIYRNKEMSDSYLLFKYIRRHSYANE